MGFERADGVPSLPPKTRIKFGNKEHVLNACSSFPFVSFLLVSFILLCLIPKR